MKQRWWVALLVTATAGAQPSIKRESGVWVVRDQGRLEAKSTLKISAPARIRVLPSRDASIQYSWMIRLPALREAEAGAAAARWAVQVKQGPDFCVLQVNGAAEPAIGELRIEVPAGAKNVVLHSSSGELNLEGLRADVQAVTGAGGVEMDRIRGNVLARTGGGAMNFGEVEGSLRVLSGGGTIRAGRIAAEAVLETAGGEIFVGEVGGTLRVSTAGNIHVGRAGRTVSAHTSGGLIEVESAGGMVTAETLGGGIIIGAAPGVRCESASGSIRLENMTGSVRASTASGNLWVGLAGERLQENSFLATGRGDITVFIPSKLAVTVKALNESGSWQNRFSSEFSEVQPRLAETSPGRPLAVEGSLNGGGPLLMLSTGNGTIYLKRRR